jgi:hypothetical protein
MASKGFWEGSTGGSDVLALNMELPRERGLRLSLLAMGVIPPSLENRRLLDGGLVASSSSFCSFIGIPPSPSLRHIRATRSACSRILTKRTAPASWIARGEESRRIRTVGCIFVELDKGAKWVAMINNEFERCDEYRSGERSWNEGEPKTSTTWGLRETRLSAWTVQGCS